MTPGELARRFEECLAAAAEWPWRDPAACAFAEWLAGCWEAACPMSPAGLPAATSRVGHDQAGLRWFVSGGAILGYATGHAPGCYRVPCGARLPAVGEKPGVVSRPAPARGGTIVDVFDALLGQASPVGGVDPERMRV